jgi:hypothetical protein
VRQYINKNNYDNYNQEFFNCLWKEKYVIAMFKIYNKFVIFKKFSKYKIIDFKCLKKKLFKTDQET